MTRFASWASPPSEGAKPTPSSAMPINLAKRSSESEVEVPKNAYFMPYDPNLSAQMVQDSSQHGNRQRQREVEPPDDDQPPPERLRAPFPDLSGEPGAEHEVVEERPGRECADEGDLDR